MEEERETLAPHCDRCVPIGRPSQTNAWALVVEKAGEQGARSVLEKDDEEEFVLEEDQVAAAV
jgi:hypothetical protein